MESHHPTQLMADQDPQKIQKTDDEWRSQLTPEQYRVTRQEGTEPAFSGDYHDNKEAGMYHCVGCGIELFSSDTKFDSGTGWPSFYDIVNAKNVGTKEDRKLFRSRTEVHCNNCGAHLGHVFDDGPETKDDGSACTGKRYCINSVSLDFKKDKE